MASATPPAEGIAKPEATSMEDLRAELARLRERNQLLEAVFEHVGEGIAFVGADGQLQLNPTGERLLGSAAKLGQPDEWADDYGLFDIDGTTLLPFDKLPLYRALLGEDSDNFELVIRNPGIPEGRLVSCVSRAMRDPSGAVVGGVALFRDVTVLRRLSNELRQQARELSQARQRADQENLYKSKFLASMSHELRTPLNAILGFSELLEQELFGPLNARQQQYVKNVLKAGRHLLQLINDILELSKIEAGRMELRREWTLPGVLVDAVQGMAQPLAARRNIDLSFAIAPEVPELYIDPLRIKQVLHNLLTNGIKFTPAGGKVALRMRTENNRLIIDVEDSGIGIAKEHLEQLFREFNRFAESSEVESEGTGLGLALTRRFVEMHGGTISVESELGKGSKFQVLLPLLGYDGKRRNRTRTPGFRDLSRVLVVEDDPLTRDTLVMQLRGCGISVAMATTAEDALRLARELRPGAILLDIRLPDADGWTVLAQLQSDVATSAIPVIVVSMLDEPERSTQLGVSSYLPKPVQRLALEQALSRAGLHVYSIHGLRALLVGTEQPYLRAIGDALRAVGCIVEYIEFDALGPRSVEGCELVVINQTSSTASSEEPPVLVSMPGKSAIPTMMLIDRAALESSGVLKSDADQQRILPLADVMDLPHLVRAVHSAVIEPLRKGSGF